MARCPGIERPIADAEIEELREEMAAQRGEIREALAEELGGDPEDYCARDYLRDQHGDRGEAVPSATTSNSGVSGRGESVNRSEYPVCLGRYTTRTPPIPPRNPCRALSLDNLHYFEF